MVTTQFIGRLGNSLFQIAACIGYAKKYSYKWGVPNYQRESSVLTHFPNLPKCDDRPKRYNEDQDGWHGTYFNYREIPNVGPDVTLFGFWQSWKYFEHAKETVKQHFKLDFIPGYENYVSLHVRRGDYVEHSDSFPPIDMHYIIRAIDMMMEFRGGKLNVAVFSDDINWCKENFKDLDCNFFYSEGRNEFQDLSLMASCGHHIIANSTFSWWGSYLGHNPDKIVISPSCQKGNWFGRGAGVKHDVVDLLPPEWIQIKFR